MNPDPNLLVELAKFTTITIAIVCGTTALVCVVALLKAPELTARVLLTATRNGNVTKLGGALVIVLAIFGLRMTDRINGDAAAAVLSGIAGYLLGDQTSRKPPHQSQDQTG
jgi:hypothetical protein